MEKKLKLIIPWSNSPGVRKMLLCMRLTFVISLVAVLQTWAAVSYSQTTTLSINLKNATVQTVLQQVEDQSEFYFLYSRSLIDVDRTVDVQLKDAKIAEVLNALFSGTDVAYKVDGRQIVLAKKSESSAFDLQQQKSVSGKVIDTSDVPLPGVTVMVKGTTQGMITDADGNYNLANVPSNATLVFSFVGMKSLEIKVDGKSSINVVMIEESIGLDEVVAVGYGTQSKRAVTGSIQSVGSKDLSDMPVSTVAQKLQGKLAGVQISQATGKPGQGMQIRIRGQASLTAGNEPLYVVDGFPITGDISSINPNEIESISVLKDASSTALYGSRAANGVILVTTKRAKLGKTSVDVAANYGIQTVPQNRRPDMMSGSEFAQWKQEMALDRGLPVAPAFQNPEQYGKGYNYYDALLRNASIQDYSVNLSSGKDNFSTTAVIGLSNQEGVILNSDYQRFSLRLNSEFKISEKVKTGYSIAPTYSINNSPSTDGQFWAGGLLTNAMLAWPIIPYKNEDGSLPLNTWIPGVSAFPSPNPIRAAQEIKNKTEQTRTLASGYLQYEPINGLAFKSSFNVDYGNTKFDNITPSTSSNAFIAVLPATSSAVFRASKYLTWLNENIVTYKTSIGSHNFDAIGGITLQRFNSSLIQDRITGYPDDRIPTIGAAANIDRSGTTNTYNDIQEWSMMSYIGRLNYNYKNKYLFSVAMRADGSSRFGKDNRWGTFPSASLGWIASDESFMKTIKAISLLKLRASYGVVGNNNIGNYTQYAAVSSGNSGYNAILGSGLASGSAVTQLPNTKLTWEQTAEFDLGFDLGLFENRVNIGYDYYIRNSKSLLYSVNVAQESGFTSFNGNIGELQFWGHEISLSTKNLTGKLKWNTDFNISFTDNKVKALYGGIDRIYSENGSNITKVGERIGLFYGMINDGVYMTKADFDASPKATISELGTVKFRDVNLDKKITNGGDKDDRTIIGDPTPTFTFGLTNNFNYRNFDLTISMSGSYGNDVAMDTEQGSLNLDGVFNVKKSVINRWKSEANPGDGKIGKAGAAASSLARDWFNSAFISDASFLTVKNVTLGYTFLQNKIKIIKSMRFYISAQQLYTFTKYKGMNPEVSSDAFGTGASALNLGHDYGSYPVPRTISIGLNIGL